MKKISKWIGTIFGILIFGTIFADADEALTNTQSSASNISQVTKAESENIAVMSVTVKQLLADYDSNEMAADKKYKDKYLKVTGVVESIDSGLMDNAIVHLGTNNVMDFMFMSVDATGDESFDNAAIELSKGQTVTLTCLSDGEFMGSPQLSECVFN